MARVWVKGISTFPRLRVCVFFLYFFSFATNNSISSLSTSFYSSDYFCLSYQQEKHKKLPPLFYFSTPSYTTPTGQTNMKSFITATAFATTALAGTVTITNNCPTGIQWKADAPNNSDSPHYLAPGSSVTVDAQGEGLAYKFTDTGDFVHPISFDLTTNNLAWYDVSDVAGHPIDVFVTPNSQDCSLVSCPAGLASGPPSPCNAPRTCPADQADFIVDLCQFSQKRRDGQEKWQPKIGRRVNMQ
jgi:hypothetical protein